MPSSRSRKALSCWAARPSREALPDPRKMLVAARGPTSAPPKSGNDRGSTSRQRGRVPAKIPACRAVALFPASAFSPRNGHWKSPRRRRHLALFFSSPRLERKSDARQPNNSPRMSPSWPFDDAIARSTIGLQSFGGGKLSNTPREAIFPLNRAERISGSTTALQANRAPLREALYCAGNWLHSFVSASVRHRLRRASNGGGRPYRGPASSNGLRSRSFSRTRRRSGPSVRR